MPISSTPPSHFMNLLALKILHCTTEMSLNPGIHVALYLININVSPFYSFSHPHLHPSNNSPPHTPYPSPSPLHLSISPTLHPSIKPTTSPNQSLPPYPPLSPPPLFFPSPFLFQSLPPKSPKSASLQSRVSSFFFTSTSLSKIPAPSLLHSPKYRTHRSHPIHH